jgi:hypothetical protein
MVALRDTEGAVCDFTLALSFLPFDDRREVELVTRDTQPRAVIHHLSVPFLAIAGDPKDFVGEGDVVDVLVLEVRVPGVRVLRVEGLAEAFGDLCGALLGYGDAMDGPPLEPGRPMVLGDRLDHRLEDSDLGKHGAIGEALFDDIPGEPPGVFITHSSVSFRNTSLR